MKITIANEVALARLAIDLGAESTGGSLSLGERPLIAAARAGDASDSSVIELTRTMILAGEDPLGDAYCSLRTPLVRRPQGQFYTPTSIIDPMLAWALAAKPTRFVDPGCGSGRFAAGAVRRDPTIAVIAVDLDPLATLTTRAVLAVLHCRDARVICGDYLTADIPEHDGRTAWVGNPPYVRHHDLTPDTKAWAGKAAAQVGHKISGLAGLHALFFLATAIHGKSGDVGSFVTSAEWLDVGYGSIVRNLFTNGLGGRALDLVDPKAIPFEDAMTTALITCFEIGREAGGVAIQLVETPHELDHRRDRSGRLDRTRTLRQATADRGAATPTRPRTEMHSSRSPAFSTRATTCIPWRRRSVPARPFSISLGISMRHQYRMTISQPSLGSRRRHAPLLRLPLAQPC